MKKSSVFIYLLLLLVSCLALTACTDKRLDLSEENTVVITVPEGTAECSLKEFMDTLVGDKFSYKMSGGMVTEINGKKNSPSDNCYWMLYTDDAQNSNEAWGKVEHKDKTYYSAVLGADTLKIKAGCTYIWKYIEVSY